MNKIICFLSAVLFLIVVNSLGLHAQEVDQEMLQLRKSFEKNDQKDLDKADKTIKEYTKEITDADKMFEQVKDLRNKAQSANAKDKKKFEKDANSIESKATKKKIKAIDKLEAPYKTFYNIYKKYIKKYSANAPEANKKQAEEFGKEYEDYYKQAKSKRQKSKSQSNDKNVLKVLIEANELENRTITVQRETFAILQGWTKIEEKKDETQVQDQTKDEKKDEVKDEKKTEEVKKDPEIKVVNTPKIIFKVQIAASNDPLTIEKLRQIFPSDEIINNEKDGDLYKYSVGSFSTYEKAYEYKKRIKVKGAFVIAYRDGVKVRNIREVAQPIGDEANLNTDYQTNNNTNTKVNTDGLEYRIQIGSTKSPVSDRDIRQMNPTTLTPKVYQVDNWYKYTIGSFSSTDEAKRFMQQYSLSPSRVFIVKYKNGVEVK